MILLPSAGGTLSQGSLLCYVMGALGTPYRSLNVSLQNNQISTWKKVRSLGRYPEEAKFCVMWKLVIWVEA